VKWFPDTRSTGPGFYEFYKTASIGMMEYWKNGIMGSRMMQFGVKNKMDNFLSINPSFLYSSIPLIHVFGTC